MNIFEYYFVSAGPWMIHIIIQTIILIVVAIFAIIKTKSKIRNLTFSIILSIINLFYCRKSDSADPIKANNTNNIC